ncbi:MAG: twin-arginine translocation signal domain-containing protein [Planctomycetota bacterium]
MISGTFGFSVPESEGNRQVKQARSRRQFLQAVGAAAV